MTVRRPSPPVLADVLERAAKTIRTNDEQTRIMADILAARGYPTHTLGNGSRSSDTTSSTERSALNPDPWADIDQLLAEVERQLWQTALKAIDLHHRILAQASTDDIIPAGTGPCTLTPICEHFCNPRKTPSDRLRRGLCPHHYNVWIRLGRPSRTELLIMLTSDEPVLATGTD